jgi:putative ABC transport system permease protein
MYVSLSGFEYTGSDGADRLRFTHELYERALHRVSTIPGVHGVGTVAHLPMAGFHYLADFVVEGLVTAPEQRPQAIDRYVSSSYHQLLSVPLLDGRHFQAHDRPDSPKVVVVNEAFARRYLQGGAVVGRRIRYGTSRSSNTDHPDWFTVVGVVGGERDGGMHEEPRPMVYLTMNQNPWTFFHLLVKSEMDLTTTVREVKRELQKISPKIAPYEIRTLDQLVLDSTWRVRYSMILLATLAAVALVMAALGVYGILSYAVRKRTREIGIRMALGAGRRAILGLVTREGVQPALLGIGAGVLAACVLTRFLDSLLFGVRPIEPLLFMLVGAFLMLVVLAACLLPARRATVVEPIEALRSE